MTSLLIALLVFASVYGGAMIGIGLQRRLPAHHLDKHSKEAVQLVMGLTATMAALVLSLLIASTHSFYETQQEEVQKLARDVVLLHEALVRYGPEAEAMRRTLREDVATATRAMSPDEGIGSAHVSPDGTARTTHLFEDLQGLEPKTKGQQFDQSKALDLMAKIASERLLIHEQATNTVPMPLVVIMVLWLTFLFVGFGLFARANGTVLVAIACGALSVAAAIFLILDMSHPYRGLIHVSGKPIHDALEQIDH